MTTPNDKKIPIQCEEFSPQARRRVCARSWLLEEFRFEPVPIHRNRPSEHMSNEASGEKTHASGWGESRIRTTNRWVWRRMSKFLRLVRAGSPCQIPSIEVRDLFECFFETSPQPVLPARENENAAGVI